ncbi:MAG TPA: ABC transporter substrate-binding protein, partial [Candidatus Limnocylindria bacterium]|nr:ABC transporter substrate-binding protein [Candidatus Limnocylindria bacterium]
MRSARLATLALVVTAALVAAPLLTEAQSPKRGGTLRVSYGNDIAHLDFHTAPGYEMMWVAMNVGCGLVNITPDGKFVGDAAESWQMSSDGLTYTFKLKKNVLFHDGTPVDATAVKFSIDRLMDPATKSGMRAFYSSVHSVEVLDPASVQIRLKQPYAFMLHMLAAYRTGLILYSPTATQKFSLDDRKQGKPGAVVGCGPFRLVEWVKGSHLLMERFDKYFVPGQPLLDKVIIRTIKDPITEMAAFKAGEIDFIASFSPEHVDTLKAQVPSANIMTGKETTPMLAAMKVTVPKDGKPMSKDRAPHPVFGDVKMRKAIGCYGIDRQEIVKIAFKGQATPWVGMTPPGTLDTVDVNHMCPYDPAKAKAMLAEMGYGPSKPLTFQLMADTEKTVFGVIATVIKEQMARLGVTANIRLVDKVSWMNTTLNDGPWDMYVEDLLSLITLDSNGYLSNSTSTWSHPRHNDTRVDELYARYAREMDVPKRKAIAK